MNLPYFYLIAFFTLKVGHPVTLSDDILGFIKVYSYTFRESNSSIFIKKQILFCKSRPHFENVKLSRVANRKS